MNTLQKCSLIGKTAEMNRLASYRSLNDHVNIPIFYSELAGAGFISTGDSSTVCCQCCGARVDVMKGHVDPKSGFCHRGGCLFLNAGGGQDWEGAGVGQGCEESGVGQDWEVAMSRHDSIETDGVANRHESINSIFNATSNNIADFTYSTSADSLNVEGSFDFSQSSSPLDSRDSHYASPVSTSVPVRPDSTTNDNVCDYSPESSDSHFYDDENFEIECDNSDSSHHLSVHRTNCSKNPGHYAYFPTRSIKPDQLPSATRNDSFLTLIKLIACLTVRIRVTCTSRARPNGDLTDLTTSVGGRYGTGFVFDDTFHEDNAQPGNGLETPRSPKFNISKKSESSFVYVYTNRHLVYDRQEALHATVDFFYDAPNGRNIVSLKGESVLFNRHPGNSQIILVCRCADTNLIKRLDETTRQMLETADQLPRRTKQCLTKKLFIIHHPHGGEQVLSYGDSVLVKFTLRPPETAAEGNGSFKLIRVTSQREVPGDLYMHRKALLYAADTCEGSSGAPVIAFRKLNQDPNDQYLLDLWMHNGVDKIHKLGASVLKVCSLSDFESGLNLSQTVGQPSDSSTSQSPGSDSDEEEGQRREQVTSPVFKVLTHPSYPAYIAYHKRKESFANWRYEILSPETLAISGFFYAGYADCVRCFQCGLGLRSWKAGDDVYTEHIKHRPSCPYLQVQARLRLHSGHDTLGLAAPAVDVTEEPGSSTTLSLLKLENRKLGEKVTCKVCNLATVKDLFLPCGELYACSDCSKLLTHCPSCNKQILATVTVFFS